MANLQTTRVTGSLIVSGASATAASTIVSVSGSSGSLFSVVDTYTGNILTVSSGSSNYFVVSSSGFVGVGKTSPSSQLDISGSSTITGSFRISGSSYAQKFLGLSTLPTIATNSGAGTTTGIVTITGSDSAGRINLNTGTSTAANSIIFSVTYSLAYASAPYAVFSPANVSSSLLSSGSMPYISASTAAWWLVSGPSAISSSAVYSWYYHIMG